MIRPYPYKIHYSDTDAGGVVYHARYLEIFERARYDYLMQQGLDVAEMARDGLIFAVVHLDISYRAPALLWFDVEVETQIIGVRSAAVKCQQFLRQRDAKQVLCEATIELVCVKNAKAYRLPEHIHELFSHLSLKN